MLTAPEVARLLGLKPRVGRVLGHRDPRSTQRYAHLTHDTLADAVGQIGQKKRIA